MSLITLGLSHIEVGVASPTGTMPLVMDKIGKTYKDTCNVEQDSSDITEHFEEGQASPLARKKSKKIPVVNFSIADADAEVLAKYVGGTDTEGVWGFNGDEVTANVAIRVVTEQGLEFEIPNADVEATISGDFSSTGIFLVNFVVTPMAVSAGKAFYGRPKAPELTVSPTALTFTSSADNTGKDVTASSSGNLTFAGFPSEIEWATVTRTNKAAKVKVSANTNSEARTAILTLVADGKTAKVLVTQAGVA